MRIIGIDLATYKRPSSLCLLENYNAKIVKALSDEEIIDIIKKFKPKAIAIDAPLSLPKKDSLRKAERELKKIKIKFFPPLMRGMRDLTYRGVKLKKALKKFKVIEVFPSGALQYFKVKPKFLPAIKRFLKKQKINLPSKVNLDALHAIVAAWIGKKYLKKETFNVGSKIEGQIAMPR